MKLISVLVFFFGTSYCVFSQDTIHFIDKSTKVVKVQEIGISEIKYHRFENLEGPLYIAGKNEIEYIRFANGNVETIVHSPSQPAQEDLKVYKQGNVISSNEKIMIVGNRLSYAGKAVGESRLYKLIINEPIPEKKKLLINEYTKMKSYKKKQYLFGFVGLGVGIASFYSGIVLSIESFDDTPVFVGLGVGAAAGLTGAILSGVFKHKRTKQRLQVARLYNE